jgi:hypothetical protein
MPLPAVRKFGDPQAAFYLVTPTLSFAPADWSTSYVMILNNEGTPVWWAKDPDGTPHDLKLVGPDELAWVRGVGGFTTGPNVWDIRGINGELREQVSPVGYGADHHDLQRTADGGWLLVVYAPRDCPATPSDCEDLSALGGPAQANVIDGVVQKVDANGNLVWQWNSRDHIDLNETDPQFVTSPARLPDGSDAYDTIHLNSVEEDGTGIVISARHLNAVYRINDPASDGSVDWKLGGSATPDRLTVTGDPFGAMPLGGQHDARILPDGTLTIHDNATLLGRPPRMVRYQLAGSTAELIESVGDAEVTGSFCCGGGRRLPGGNWVASWGASPVMGEYDADGERVLRLTWPGALFSYRIKGASASELSGAALRAGMNARFPR